MEVWVDGCVVQGWQWREEASLMWRFGGVHRQNWKAEEEQVPASLPSSPSSSSKWKSRTDTGLSCCLSSTTTMLAPISFFRPTAESPSASACTCHHPPLATVNTLPHMDLCAHAVSTRQCYKYSKSRTQETVGCRRRCGSRACRGHVQDGKYGSWSAESAAHMTPHMIEQWPIACLF